MAEVSVGPFARGSTRRILESHLGLERGRLWEALTAQESGLMPPLRPVETAPAELLRSRRAWRGGLDPRDLVLGSRLIGQRPLPRLVGREVKVNSKPVAPVLLGRVAPASVEVRDLSRTPHLLALRFAGAARAQFQANFRGCVKRENATGCGRKLDPVENFLRGRCSNRSCPS